jgi:hypothetical protein
MLQRRFVVIALTSAAVFAMAFPSGAVGQETNPTQFALKTRIPIPPWAGVDPATISIDISWIDPTNGLFVIGDRTTAAVDTFDINGYAFLQAAGQGSFVGAAPTGTGGPNGVTVVGPREVAGGDGDSTLKIINLDSGEVQTVDTGGTHRVDEMAYDAVTDTLVAANDREGGTANFLTVFKAHPLHIVGKIPCPQCLGGIEQPLVVNGQFYVAFPSTTTNSGGEIDHINTNTLKLDQVIKASDCGPTGLAAGVNGLLVTGGSGCVVDPRTQTGTRITDAGGDEIATLPGSGTYAFVIAGTQTLNLVDAGTQEVYQKLPVAMGHNLAANSANGEIWVPDYQSHSVLVFAPVTARSK